MDGKELTKLLARMFLAYFVLLAAFTCCGSFYAKSLFPLFRYEIALLSSKVHVLSMGFESIEDQQMLSMVVNLAAPRVNRRLLFRWPPMNLYLHPIIIFTIIFAWPRITGTDRAKLFAMTLPLLLILEMLDMPLVVLSRSGANVQALLAGEGISPPLADDYWLIFLSNGGREFLSVCVALLAVAMLYLSKARDIPEPGRNAPCPCGSGKKYKICCMTR